MDRTGVEIAVAGEHLSGLSLHPELVARGAAFRRHAMTTPNYRLYVLFDSVPPQPALLRVTPGEGESIAAEIWSLDLANFGDFVAALPAPLAIGTLTFADGTNAKGVICEPEALYGARDISHFRSWRDYLDNPR